MNGDSTSFKGADSYNGEAGPAGPSSMQTLDPAACSPISIPNFYNASLTTCLIQVPVATKISRIGLFITQATTGYNFIQLGIYDSRNGALIARTGNIGTSVHPTGFQAGAIQFDGAGNPITEITLPANPYGYFLAIYCPSGQANGTNILGRDNGTTFSSSPWISATKNAVGASFPTTIGYDSSHSNGWSETSLRAFISMWYE